jgi:hypothetical protein
VGLDSLIRVVSRRESHHILDNEGVSRRLGEMIPIFFRILIALWLVVASLGFGVFLMITDELFGVMNPGPSNLYQWPWSWSRIFPFLTHKGEQQTVWVSWEFCFVALLLIYFSIVTSLIVFLFVG